MTRWAQGARVIEDALGAGELEVVAASPEHAATLLADAARHLRSAELLAESDPAAAYSVMYDGARKALAAVLAKQGLRATSRGGHVAVQDAVEAQLGNAKTIIRSFDGMRRRRHRAEYPSEDTPELTTDDVREAIPKAKGIVDAASQLVGLLTAWT
jgi:uncharacterized protein (UPF0332 family)